MSHHRPYRRTVVRLFASLTFISSLSVCASVPAHATPMFADCSGHPRNAQGFVTDGTPQCGDQWCVGNPDQVMECTIARRPTSPGWACAGGYKDRQTALDCWGAGINAYDWPHDAMFDALYCESKGDQNATNGRYRNLFQSNDAPDGDPVGAFLDAYHNKWAGQQSYAWTATYGRYCPS